jgi:hypothetical protein
MSEACWFNRTAPPVGKRRGEGREGREDEVREKVRREEKIKEREGCEEKRVEKKMRNLLHYSPLLFTATIVHE